MDVLNDLLPSVARLSSDIKNAVTTLGPDQARFLVDAYYMMQDDRKRSANQALSLEKSEEPNEVLRWLTGHNRTLENQIKTILDHWTDTQPMGVWAKAITGIGPVLSGGLLAHIDIAKAPTVGHIWRFAGLDPTLVWEKGKKRPWNASLKTLCWKIGESFVKVSGRESDVYGKIYIQRKEYERRRNERGELADQAAAKLSKYKIGKDTEAYKHYSMGRLPDAHIHARAKRYAVKQFLSDYHAEAYRLHFGIDPPKPYPIAILGHVHERLAISFDRTI